MIKMKIMKKIFYIGVALLATSLVSCNDLLDKAPLDTFTNTPAYWSNTKNLENQCNTFYNNYSGYGNWFYFKTLSDDQVNADGNLNWTYTNVPTASSNWNGPFTEIRRANYILKGIEISTLDEKSTKPYAGIARLNRAWEYYQLVREYGDVQWIDYVMDPADKDNLYAARDDRDEVMDHVLEDLKFAVEAVGGSRKDRFSSDMARAMLADVALYEGTYCKYRTAAENAGKAADPARAKKYLQECVAACQAIMSNAAYVLPDDYKSLYNSLDLGGHKDVIFYKPYAENLMCHSLIDYTVNTSGTHGMSKDAFDSFLFLDGKPRATTGLDRNDAAKLVEREVKVKDSTIVDTCYSLNDVLAVRDKRLSVILDPVLVIKGCPYSREGTAEYTSSTGYGIAKYDNWKELTVFQRNNIGKQFTDAPLYWLSVIYLNFAEAKAELGELTQADLDASINKLQVRAGLPKMTVAPAADPANNMNVSPIIWEIRRCRRCELFCDNWYRYWDLIRWHQLELLDSEKHPDIYLGANLKNVVKPEVDLNSEKYMQGSNTLNLKRIYDKKHYFYPVPNGQLILNEKLTQNPGWES